MDKGVRSYAVALNRTNAALTNPATAVLDETLAAILLLAVFEGSVFPGARSPEEWTAHLLGATRLLQLRGLNQFQSETGRHLYNHITSNICASCMQRLVDLPAEFQSWNDKVRPSLDSNYRNSKFIAILQNAVSFKARLWAKLDTDTDVLYDLFHEAASLEQETAALKDECDPELSHTVRSAEETPPWAYDGIAYHYKTHRAAKQQNNLRMVRLFIQEVMSAGASVAMKKIHNQAGTARYYENAREEARKLSAEVSTEILGYVQNCWSRMQRLQVHDSLLRQGQSYGR
jgi:hypothetical protein